MTHFALARIDRITIDYTCLKIRGWRGPKSKYDNVKTQPSRLTAITADG